MDLANVKEETNQQQQDINEMSPNKDEINVRKKQLTLNLNSRDKGLKKRAVNPNNINDNPSSLSSLLGPSFWNHNSINNIVLESPDVQMLKLQTPEVENYILSIKQTPTPSLANLKFNDNQLIKHLNDHLANQLGNPQNNNNSSNSDSSRPPSNASSNFYNHNSDNFNLQDENSNATSLVSGGNNSNCSFNTSNNSGNNQSFSENSELNQINMLKNQDLSKLERKRLRNRIAASKCRKRKLERISNLEDKVQKLKDDNQKLLMELDELKRNNEKLKNEVYKHKQKGCNIDVSLMMQS